MKTMTASQTAALEETLAKIRKVFEDGFGGGLAARQNLPADCIMDRYELTVEEYDQTVFTEKLEDLLTTATDANSWMPRG